ncbi:hypothetical protein CSA08_04680 [Candidatus Gracilibacteria bacterium]|nr:MAG: hypothetical protein CSA08_04680 [Candidatus Gracilibacteria bacterium]
MKKLIIGLGGCGNNIINLLQNKIDNSSKTLSVQKDIQLFTISKADFKLNPKEIDFENKLKLLFEHTSKVILILGTAGNSSLLYLDKLVRILNENKVLFNIIAIEPMKIEGNKRFENSEITNKYIKNFTKNHTFIKGYRPEEIDEKVIQIILDYSISLKKVIEIIQKNKMCISDAYAIGSCSTCGCGEADKLVKKIKNIEIELKNFDIEKMIKKIISLSSYRDMPIELKVIIFIFYRVTFNKEEVLDYWIENLSDKCIKFYDSILFYVLRNKPFSKELKDKWLKRCSLLSEKYNNYSLKETIKYCNTGVEV